MANKKERIAGTRSLSEIESAIKFEEAKSFEFLTSSVQNDASNLVDFKELELGNFPNDLRLTLGTDPAPEGYGPFPNNPIEMIVGGSKENVKAWRQQ